MFGKKRRKKNDETPDILSDLRRGGSAPVPLAAVRKFPTAEDITNNPALEFQLPNHAGKQFLGLADAQMKVYSDKQGNTSHYASGGSMVGISEDRHAFACSGSRGGKMVSIIGPQLLTYPGNILLIDPKGDGARNYAFYRSIMFSGADGMHVIDPFGAAGSDIVEFLSSYNPMIGIDPTDESKTISRAILIADAIVQETSAKDPHWDLSAKAFLEAVILYVLADPEIPDACRNLPMVHTCCYKGTLSKEKKDSLQERMEQTLALGEIGDAIRRGAANFYEKEERERSGVLSSLRRHIHFLGYPDIKRVLTSHQGGRTIDLNHITSQSMTIFLSLPVSKMQSCASLLRLFINMTLVALEENKQRNAFQEQRAESHRLLMILDEFPVLKRMEQLITNSGAIAGMGGRLFPIVQDLNQMRTYYEKEWETFLANSGILQFFACTDLTTLGWIEQKLGDTKVHSPKFQAPAPQDTLSKGLDGGSFSFEKHPLLAKAELETILRRNDPYHRQLVFTADHGPMILQRPLTYRYEVFLKLMERCMAKKDS